MMQYRNLGSTGTLVTDLCLGTMTFGNESDEATAHDQLDRYIEAGGNFIDTADVYQHGEAEEMVGRCCPSGVSVTTSSSARRRALP